MQEVGSDFHISLKPRSNLPPAVGWVAGDSDGGEAVISGTSLCDGPCSGEQHSQQRHDGRSVPTPEEPTHWVEVADETGESDRKSISRCVGSHTGECKTPSAKNSGLKSRFDSDPICLVGSHITIHPPVVRMV